MQPDAAPSLRADDEAKMLKPAEETLPPMDPLPGKPDVSEPAAPAPGTEMSSTPAESSTGNDGAENEAIAGDGESPTPAVPPPTQLEGTQDGRQTPDTAEARPPPAAPLPGQKKTRGKATVSGRAAANAYWKKLGQEGGLNVSTVKHVFSTIRKVAAQDLKETGTFKVHGILGRSIWSHIGMVPTGIEFNQYETFHYGTICGPPGGNIWSHTGMPLPGPD